MSRQEPYVVKPQSGHCLLESCCWFDSAGGNRRWLASLSFAEHYGAELPRRVWAFTSLQASLFAILSRHDGLDKREEDTLVSSQVLASKTS